MKAALKIFNTLTRQVETLEPIIPGKVGIYCCGPTVYGYQHIGNFKTFLFEDLLVRTLRFLGYEVKHVMNITDVGHLTDDADDGEDKMLLAVRREKKSSHDIASYYTEKFFADWDALGLLRPSIVCKATEHIPEMIALIQRIESAGFAYFANGNVYFDVEKFKDYGNLAKLDLEKLKAGARIHVDPHKRSPHDFVLWFTKSKFENQELQWDSPWGRGYPGWHIECSAMSMKYLGEQFDIHCGGIDHIPVHHTNEIAQSEAATGKKWVNVWMHSEFILLNSEKMSKSKGGILVLDDILEKGLSAASYRFFCLSASYRSQLNFSWEALEAAEKNVTKLRNAVLTLKEKCSNPSSQWDAAAKELEQSFTDALCSDLNTAAALAVVWQTLSSTAIQDDQKLGLLYHFDQVLGFSMQAWQAESLTIPDEVRKLAEQRVQARSQKDWAEADRLRDALAAHGYQVLDATDGYEIRKL